MTETTLHILFFIMGIAIIFLLIGFLRLINKIDASEERSFLRAKTAIDIKIKELDRKTPKYHIGDNGEVEIRTPDNKYPIHFWKLDKTTLKK